MELAALIRDRLEDDRKAISIYERVLEIDPEHLEALEAVAGLYGKTGNYQRLAYSDEKLLERAEEPETRRKLLLEIGDIYERHLGEPARGFEWFRRAYLEGPTAENLQVVDQAADRHGLHEELIQIYEGARERAVEPFEQLAASLKIALICEEKLDDPGRAFRILVDALPHRSGRRRAAAQPRTAGRAHRRLEEPAGRLRPGRARPDRDRGAGRALAPARRRAREADGRPFGRPRRDAAQLRDLEPRNPTDPGPGRNSASGPDHRPLGRGHQGQGQLFALAEELADKLTVARNAAHLVEHEVKDLVRAFRAYLNAFRLAPDDEEIVAHLWRLAGEIGRYAPAVEEAPEVEPTAEVVAEVVQAPETELEAEPASADAQAEDEAEDDDEETDASLDVVSEVDVDLEVSGEIAREAQEAEVEADAEAEQPVDEAAPPPADEGEGIVAASEASRDAFEDESIEVLGDEELMEEEEAEVELARPPSPPSAVHQEDQPFATPWEELAAAYESLPAEDADDRWVYLRKIAEVWERGQHDIDRALDALERAFKLDITDVDVRGELERIAAAYDRWDRIAKIYLGAIDEFGAIETAVMLHHDAARLRERWDRSPKRRSSIARSCACDPTIPSRSGGSRRSADRKSAGRTWPTSSSSAPARRPRRCERPGAARAPARAGRPARGAAGAPVRGHRYAGEAAARVFG